ncbi:MAG: helix-hairpin-helix domain-containing protein [Desulforhopalus sp.]|jgi:competence ComEA-like helix-hairpin-helix protein|nr:helix-hairpin-helix domain-containing protein [Desulforhopalus sp.]
MSDADQPIGREVIVKAQPRPAVDRRISLFLLLAGVLLMVDSAQLLSRFLAPGEVAVEKCQRLEKSGDYNRLVDVACRSDSDPDSSQAAKGLYTPFSFQPIPINSADPELLMTVRGIGPRLADNIFRYREENGPLTSGSDLTAIPGIGEKTAARFAPHFSFTPQP